MLERVNDSTRLLLLRKWIRMLQSDIFQKSFYTSKKRHVLMITHHGIHQWNVIPGLPDTGGQNVFVNQLADTLERQGLKITIVNRGGYAHPITGETHRGVEYKNENCRILYIEDDRKAFVLKEERVENLPTLAAFLYAFLQSEMLPIDLIISHYWDGAMLGIMLNWKLEEKLPHVWIPHSLGSIKKETWIPGDGKHFELINASPMSTKSFKRWTPSPIPPLSSEMRS
jgi:hypothetical protein